MTGWIATCRNSQLSESAMPSSTARLPTANGSKYLQQLCKHFAHKIDVEFTPTHGEIRFSIGTATIDADADGLSMTAQAEDGDKLGQTQHVIESHLVRFAFREEIGPLDWVVATA
jgi:hypothetical protein